MSTAAIVGIVVLVVVLPIGGLFLFTAWTAARVKKALPPLGRMIEIDGQRIHYLDEGSGPPLLCIHGLAGQMRNFTQFLLAPLKADHRVIILDRPGSGYSPRKASTPAALAAQAKTIARFIDALNLDRPLLVGHSLGGGIALATALDHPDKVGGLALLAPASHPQKEVPGPFHGLTMRSAVIRNFMAWTVAAPLSMMARDVVLEMLFGPQKAPADFATKGGALMSLLPSTVVGASRDLMATLDDLPALPPRYHAIDVPVGILHGTKDQILNIDVHGRALAAKIKGAEFETIDGAGHMILICSADHCAQFIRRMAHKVFAQDAQAQQEGLARNVVVVTTSPKPAPARRMHTER